MTDTNPIPQTPEDLQSLVDELKIRLRHLENDFALTRAENESATMRYLEILAEVQAKNAELEAMKNSLEERVCERTAQLEVSNHALQRETNEHRRTEVILRESEDRYRTLVEISPDVILLLSLDGGILFANHQAVLTFGYDRVDDLKSMLLFELLAPDAQDRVHQDMQYLILKGIVRNQEYAFLRRDGGRFPAEVYMSILRGTEGRPKSIVCVARDITERKRAEEAYHRLVDNSLQGLIIQQDDRIVFANRAMTEILGFTVEELVALPPGSGTQHLVHPDDQAMLQQRYNARLRGEPQPAQYEMRAFRKDGSMVWLDAYSVLIEYHGRPAVQSALVDVTQRKLAVEALHASLKEKDVLLKEIYHRVKNNLQIVSSLLNLPCRHIKDPEALRVFKESQDRIWSMSLVHEELYKSSDLATVNFTKYLERLVGNLLKAYLVEPGAVEIRMELDEHHLSIDQAIPCGLILNELVTNALRHGFTAEMLKGHANVITIAISRTEHDMQIYVEDNGKPFPSDVDIMNTRTMGLQLVVLLVQQIRGTISLNRQQGAAFTISFPM